MKSKIKFAAALTALTVATTFAIPSSEAEARRWGYWGVGALATGVILGAAMASQPVYAAPSRCWRERRFDAYGNYMGKVTVCSRY